MFLELTNVSITPTLFTFLNQERNVGTTEGRNFLIFNLYPYFCKASVLPHTRSPSCDVRNESPGILMKIWRSNCDRLAQPPPSPRERSLLGIFVKVTFVLGGRFEYFLFLSARGRGRGSPGRPRGGEVGFLLKIPGRKGVPQDRGGGEGVCRKFERGGGAKYFFRGAEMPTKCVTRHRGKWGRPRRG